MSAPATSTRSTGATTPIRGRLVVTARADGDPVARDARQRSTPTHLTPHSREGLT